MDHELDDESEINEDVQKGVRRGFLILVAAVCVLGLIVGTAYLFASKKAGQNSIPFPISPRAGSCGDMVDAAAVIEKFDHFYPGRRKNMQVEKRNSASPEPFGKCVVSVIIYYDGEPIRVRPVPKPATLGGEERNLQRI